MIAPEPNAPATVFPLDGQSADARGIATKATARSAQSFPLATAARALLVRRAMVLHVGAAEDFMRGLDDDLLAAGDGEAMAIAIEGLREAARVLELRMDLRRVSG